MGIFTGTADSPGISRKHFGVNQNGRSVGPTNNVGRVWICLCSLCSTFLWGLTSLDPYICVFEPWLACHCTQIGAFDACTMFPQRQLQWQAATLAPTASKLLWTPKEAVSTGKLSNLSSKPFNFPTPWAMSFPLHQHTFGLRKCMKAMQQPPASFG